LERGDLVEISGPSGSGKYPSSRSQEKADDRQNDDAVVPAHDQYPPFSIYVPLPKSYPPGSRREGSMCLLALSHHPSVANPDTQKETVRIRRTSHRLPSRANRHEARTSISNRSTRKGVIRKIEGNASKTEVQDLVTCSKVALVSERRRDGSGGL